MPPASSRKYTRSWSHGSSEHVRRGHRENALSHAEYRSQDRPSLQPRSPCSGSFGAGAAVVPADAADPAEGVLEIDVRPETVQTVGGVVGRCERELGVRADFGLQCEEWG